MFQIFPTDIPYIFFGSLMWFRLDETESLFSWLVQYPIYSYIWVDQKVHLFFFCKMVLVVLSCL